ncbi:MULTISPECIES: urease subunit alpha [Mycobacteriaceae]|uniref:Urease subunit alpha n=1 Tax=Mycolicibacterium neoaurum VKM Ac-1815D TaxID=700508 RepID=V5XHI9_MYCNE|nr:MULTISPECIES: urease subunit alpha [Mycobacteriaceae]AHC27298.1 urease subunit alpha [Mycolicibacterium neoaurum VKM Ac-1815D]AMO07529.1 urease subunit alpha [Mycolicibacterium neoaurum]AXK74081.1 urease subunit alpha [Mycolicibacterium neoaurum]KJQ51483.1 urease subunit alpha [Mycolicibacterium neoaurum]KUM08941.1 urease subunit alpha [Mycolicibacterium neoaurum]
MAYRISRARYAELYGPTTGDRVRLADTELLARVEADACVYGDEAVFGGGKTMREGMAVHGDMTNGDGALDFVITNALIIDAVLGIRKADIGIRNGRIVGIGKAGNPRTMDGVHPDLIIGAGTDIRSGEGMIATAGAIDVHVHFDSAGLVEEAISSGITTMIGGGLGPVTVGITSSGPTNLARMLRAAEAFPMNFGFIGNGSASGTAPLIEQGLAGAIGFKIHEDWGATPAAIRASLDAGDELDLQVQIHTDTLNESGFYEDTMAAIGGRVIHTYHAEGAGGGHAPDIMQVVGEPYCLPSSTNPTNPYTLNTFDEHLDMVMVCHHLNPRIPEDVAFAESRIRRETIAAEDVLHDMGAISAMGSDSQGMGRIGETIARTWQLASHMRATRGPLPADEGTGADNARILRYIAKLTINPARLFGIDHEVGSLEPGKLADIVLWEPKFFGIRPEVVFKGGFPAWSVMGEANASLMTCEPLKYRPQWAAYGQTPTDVSVNFVAAAAIDAGLGARLGLQTPLVACRGSRGLTKADLLHNDYLPDIRIEPDTYRVIVDGQLCQSVPMTTVPLGRRYTLK